MVFFSVIRAKRPSMQNSPPPPLPRVARVPFQPTTVVNQLDQLHRMILADSGQHIHLQIIQKIQRNTIGFFWENANV